MWGCEIKQTIGTVWVALYILPRNSDVLFVNGASVQGRGAGSEGV